MLRIIATFILIYFIFRLLTYYVFPWIVKWYFARFKKKFYEQNPHLRPEDHTQTKKSGIKITMNKKEAHSKIDDSIGEYVDFEEVKDKKKDN